MGLDTGTAEALRAACGGAFHVPGEAGYDAGRRAWNDVCDQRPVAVGYPADADEVAAVLRIASAAGLRVAPQLTGRAAAQLGALDDVILLRLAGLRGVEVDPSRRVARVGAGVLWLDLVTAAARQGLAVAHPWVSDVGVVGHCLDAGTGPYARLLGLAAGAVVGAQLVTPDGQLHQLTGDGDLLWLLRGGGGGAGVVTSLDLQLASAASVYGGSLRWSGSRAADILERWVEWCSSAPEAITTRFRVVPEAADDASYSVIIDGLIAADDAVAVRALAGLRAAGPEHDSFSARTTEQACGLFSSAASGQSVFASGLPSAARAALLERVTGSPGGVEMYQLGGAAARPSRREGARTYVDGEFAIAGYGPDDLAVGLDRWFAPVTWPADVAARRADLRSRLDPDHLLVSASLVDSAIG